MQVISNEQRIQILSDLVSIKSVNGDELQVATYLKQLLSEYDIEAKIIELPEEGRANLVAEIGEGKPVLGISGHMDVVDAGDIDKWTHPPYELTEDDGKLYGRGSSDMKSGLAGYVIALIEIKENKLLKKGTVRLMATSGEELGQIGSSAYYEDGYMEDIEALMISEPSNKIINYANKGSMNVKVSSLGVSSHSSMPFAGKSAIDPLLGFIEDVKIRVEEEAKNTEATAFDFKDWLKGSFEGMDIDFDETSKYLNNTLMTNTVIDAGNQVNSVPEKAVAYFNVRTVPEFNNTRVKEIFNEVLKEHNENGGELNLDWELDLDSAITDGNNLLVDIHQQVAEEYFGEKYPAYPTTGVTDASNLIKGKPMSYPFVVFGPGEISVVHKVDEYVEKNLYLKFTDLYQDIIVRFTNEFEG